MRTSLSLPVYTKRMAGRLNAGKVEAGRGNPPRYDMNPVATPAT